MSCAAAGLKMDLKNVVDCSGAIPRTQGLSKSHCNILELISMTPEELDTLLRPHVIGCSSLRDVKHKVDLALDRGQKMPCPLGPA